MELKYKDFKDFLQKEWALALPLVLGEFFTYSCMFITSLKSIKSFFDGLCCIIIMIIFLLVFALAGFLSFCAAKKFMDYIYIHNVVFQFLLGLLLPICIVIFLMLFFSGTIESIFDPRFL